MIRRNTARRAALVDAAIEVPVEEGAHGLTFGAVDHPGRCPATWTSSTGS
ncbi:DNA-binding transcriptional regulator YbjK [Nonomuraea thailandensis]|uniref:DNA-binding transcriptional regulator YbjK n=1 Tax=Nonomuraea thailandensis TaxID=1188745 RepID=A0A9X2GQN2_9ACTN|nr:DNA-binding transcriptional regulator YbjK [Nonomuraea thailandensis]